MLTINTGKGPVAKINVERNTSPITYSRAGTSKLVDIRNGKVNLKKKLDESNAAELNNTKITIPTSGGTTTSVVIFILLLYFGDNFVDLVEMRSNSKDKRSHHSLRPITPIALLRFIRRPNEKARKITMAQQDLEMKIAKIKKLILKLLGKSLK